MVRLKSSKTKYVYLLCVRSTSSSFHCRFHREEKSETHARKKKQFTPASHVVSSGNIHLNESEFLNENSRFKFSCKM